MIRKNLLSPAVVLKVAHQGSKTSITSAFLSTIEPGIAIISIGAGNIYGYPDVGVVSRLEKIGAKVHRTDMNGTVSVKTDGESWQIETELMMRRELPHQNRGPTGTRARNTMGARTRTCSTTHGVSMRPASSPTTCGFSAAGKRRLIEGIGRARCASHELGLFMRVVSSPMMRY